MQKLKSSLNESLNESLNQRLQAKYPHLELAVLPLSEVNKDNESKRIDSEYFKKEYLLEMSKLFNIRHFKLKNIATIKGGKRLPLNENFVDDFDGIPYIRAEDIKNGFVEFENSPKISKKLHNQLSNYQTHYNDVLLTIVGNSIGDVGLVKFILEKCNLTENCAKLTNLTNINAETLFIFLQSLLGQFQIKREVVGTAQPKLALERIRDFIIPQFSQDFQLEIEKLVKDSHKALEDSKTLYKEAQNLLYESLGLDSKNPLESLMRDTLATSCHTEALAEVSKNDSVDLMDTKDTHNDDIATKYPHLNISIRQLSQSYGKSGRLDSEYYQSKYDAIERTIKGFSHKKLGDLVTIQKSIEPGSEAYQDEGIEFVRVANLSKFGISKSDICLNRQDFGKDLERLAPKKRNDFIKQRR